MNPADAPNAMLRVLLQSAK
jgi:hypothetical protein